MARTLQLDTITEPSNSGTANITLSSDTTTTMPKVDINSGTIDNTTIGASTPSTVAATNISCTSVTAGAWNGTAVALAKGGTGATTAAAARTALEVAGVPKIIKHVHIHGSDYTLTGNGGSQVVPHDAVSYTIVSGKTYKVEAMFSIEPQTKIYAFLHVQPVTRSQGDSQSNDAVDAIGGSASLKQGDIGALDTTSSSSNYLSGTYTAAASLLGTTTTTHYTYISYYGHGTTGHKFLLNSQPSAHPTSHNSTWTEHNGVLCQFIISEFSDAVTITNQAAS